MFDSAEGPAYKQIINMSEWNAIVSVTLENVNVLIDIIIEEETVNRSKKKIDAIRSGLDMLGFGKYMHLPVTKELFVGEKM